MQDGKKFNFDVLNKCDRKFNKKILSELKSQMLKRFQFPAHFDLFSFYIIFFLKLKQHSLIYFLVVVAILLCLNRGSHYRLLMTFYF